MAGLGEPVTLQVKETVLSAARDIVMSIGLSEIAGSAEEREGWGGMGRGEGIAERGERRGEGGDKEGD